MKERGMIFNAEMVKALLDGRKTQTRRPVKPQPNISYFPKRIPEGWNGSFSVDGGKSFKCPFGVVGDRIWVRETFWLVDSWAMGDIPCVLYADEFEKYQDEGWQCYQSYDFWSKRAYHGKYTFGCKPPIHMPRWASRITLEITDVRVDRVQDISYSDAYAEGVERKSGDCLDHFMEFKRGNSIRAFEMGWNSIYNNWDDNPWVWVVEFKVAL